MENSSGRLSDRLRAVRGEVEGQPSGLRAHQRSCEMPEYMIAFNDEWTLDSTAICSVVPEDESPVFTDGPFVETKEHLGGFIIVDVDTLEDALKWAGKCAAACRATMQVRELLSGAEAR